ncbi:MAG: ATP-binding protein [Halodesulfovibrio sp.]
MGLFSGGGNRFSITRAALKTAIIYAVFGLLWIRFSDLFLEYTIHDASVMTTIQTYKGWFFILVTSGLLFLLIRRNMQAQRHSELSLRASNMRLEGMFRVAGGVAFILSRQRGGLHFIEAFSPGAVRMFGLEFTDAGRPVAGLPLPAGLFSVYEGEDGVGGMNELTFRDRAGQDKVVLARTLALDPEDDGTEVMLSVALDITERKRMAQRLEAATGMINGILDAVPSIMICLDDAMRVMHWNAAAQACTGLELAKVKGRPLNKVFPLLGTRWQELSIAVSSRSSMTLQLRSVRRMCVLEDDAEAEPEVDAAKVYEVQVFPLPLAEGGAVVRLDDITERMKVQEVLVQTEKIMSVGGLAAGMAHEINNPLGAILQGIQNVRRRLSADLPANLEAAGAVQCDLEALDRYMRHRGIDRMLDGMSEAGKRAAEIVTNMLDFARSADLSHSGVHINQIADKALSLIDNDYSLEKRYDFRKIKVVREYAGDLPMISCSRIGVEQVLVNLLRNAAQAMYAYEGDPERVPEIRVRTYASDSSVCIDVQDNGPGMTEAQSRRVFEPFYTTKPSGEGTGLGLSVSHFIITSGHNGTFSVESAPGRGASFRICLPVRAG